MTNTTIDMKRFFTLMVLALMGIVLPLQAQQLPNAGFEDWSGASFDGNIQPASWNASNVTQFGFKFNFAHREAGHTGSFSMRVQDQDIGAAGITETSPGYFSLGQPWVYIESITKVSYATAGTAGGIQFAYRPDTMAVWIRRTGSKALQEDFHLLFYSWKGNAVGNKYKAKNGSCTSVEKTNEESDIRLSTNGNECGTAKKAAQVAEGWWKERKVYNDWTLVKVPIYYMSNDVPDMCNVIFSASNYPNFRANSGLYDGNSLYVDDVELIYASSIQTLYVGGLPWNGFNPNTEEEQIYSLGDANTVPDIYAMRGMGTFTNSKGEVATFPGRRLTGDEIIIQKGGVGEVTTITVRSGDGKSSTTYRIRFMKKASDNAYLSALWMKNGKDSTKVENFNPYTTNCEISLPYGTTAVPQLSYDKREQGQDVSIQQATSLTDKAIVTVTAADRVTKRTYTISFKVAELADNTLADILVNGSSLAGFVPSQAIYRVSLPLGTDKVPDVQAVSAYPAGAQTITYTAPDVVEGGVYQISVSTPGNKTPKVYKLTFKLEPSSYSKLKDIQVGGVSLEGFQPDQYTYYVTLPMGTVTMPAITWTKGDPYQSEPVLTSGGINGTSLLTVKAASGAQSVYKLIFSTPLSEENRLSAIYVGGTLIDGFSEDTYIYKDLPLPQGTNAVPAITYDKMEETETVNVIDGGLYGTTRIIVTAADGTPAVYQLSFTVTTSSDATLKSLSVEGYDLDFRSDRLEYDIQLPQGTEAIPAVHYEANDAFQTVTPRDGTVKGNGDYRITVRPQTGKSQVYIIHFHVTTSANDSLQMITIDGQPMAAFRPQVNEYEYRLPDGVSTIPEVGYQQYSGEIGVQQIQPIRDRTMRGFVVTAANGTERTYRITFIITPITTAFLKSISVGGKELDGFRPDQYEYEYTLNTDTCPLISVEPEVEQQQVIISAPHAAGTATIRVLPERGATSGSTYTIHFIASASSEVQLDSICLDGVLIDGFQSNILTYNGLVYTTALPKITYAKPDGVEVKQLVNRDQVMLCVTKGKLSAMYTLNFVKTVSPDCTLKGIYLDGQLIENWNPQTNDYIVSLAAGQAEPVVTYERGNENQSVVFGQQEEHLTQIIVTAATGTQGVYTVRFDCASYTDANLKSLSVEGMSIPFAEDTYDYTLELAVGAELPQLHFITKPGQSTIYSKTSPDDQQVLVIAEDGTTAEYNVHYVRKSSSNALLADILIDGVSLEGFQPTIFHYVDTLPLGTKVVPNVFAIGQLSNQTITTYFSAVNGTTRIEVESASGDNRSEYTIEFPVVKSSENRLAEIYIADENAQIDFDPDVLEYSFLLPVGTTMLPTVTYTPAEPSQRIRFEANTLNDTSRIVVRAENGDERIYKLYFEVQVPTEPNILKALTIRETGEHLDMSDANQREFTVTLPYGTKTMTVDYTKNYATQTVFAQSGGVFRPTVLTVKSNRFGVADEVYTITPVVDTQNPAVLSNLTVNGVQVPGFDKNRFSYIVPVESTPNPSYEPYNGATVIPLTSNEKHHIFTVTAKGYTNVYHLWYYYTKEVVPNAEFDANSFVSASTYTSAQKPQGWYCLADVLGKHQGFFSFTPDKLVRQYGTSDVVQLQSRYSVPGGGDVPGFISLAPIENTNWGVSASTVIKVSGGIPFHNSPDVMSVRYNLTQVLDSNQIIYSLTGSSGSKTLEWGRTSKTNDYQVFDFDLSPVNNAVGYPMLLNIVINSYKKIGCSTHVGRITETVEAEMYVDWLRFTYNNRLTAVTANGIAATLSGNAFTATLTNSEQTDIPQLVFTGEVSDQAQKVEWANAGAEQRNGDYAERTATITNYGEDGASSAYTLLVRRPLDTRTQLKALVMGEDTIPMPEDSYTLYLSPTARVMKDITPIPLTSLQTITTVYSETDGAHSTLTITVTAENGDTKTYTVNFVVEVPNDPTLQSLTAGNQSLNVTLDKQEITSAETMPLLTFGKRDDGQKVVVEYDKVTVTAEGGAQKVYTFSFTPLRPVTTGLLSEIELDRNVQTDFGGTAFEATKPMPEYTSFVRQDAIDSVIYIQRLTGMEWQVYGTENHSYILSYPGTASGNTALADILVNGTSLEGFVPTISDYVYATDSLVQLEIVKAEAEQSVTIRLEQQQHTGARRGPSMQNDLTFTITVTAPNGTEGTPYVVKIQADQSGIATLRSILLDDKEIPDFRADSFMYDIVLPTPAVKLTEPALPTITYQVGQESQQVTVTTGALGGTTTLEVQPERGVSSQYLLTISAEPSHNADLTGIIVNGTPVERFEVGRHYYSARSLTEQIEVIGTADDRFQQPIAIDIDTIDDNTLIYTLHVVAQDMTTTQDYLVEVYVESQSSDATLANIRLDGQELRVYQDSINPKLEFDSQNNRYEVNLPAGTSRLPEVSAVLKMEGQRIESVSSDSNTVYIDVVAKDGLHTNRYTLDFIVPLSRNVGLGMISVNNRDIEGFSADTIFYSVILPKGESIPAKIVGTPADDAQTIAPVEWDGNIATLRVTAEDTTAARTYVILCKETPDSVNTLEMLYLDDDTLTYVSGHDTLPFSSDRFNYFIELPVGTTDYPVLSGYENISGWPKGVVDTIHNDKQQQVLGITVTPESGPSNRYNIIFEIKKSDLCTLKNLFVNNEALTGFRDTVFEYSYELSAGQTEMPDIIPVKADEYQTVSTRIVTDSIATKSLNKKVEITVTAQNGNSHVYTIHFPVALSSNTQLSMIWNNGYPVSTFVKELPECSIEVPYDESGAHLMPAITVSKAEDAQNVDIVQYGDSLMLIRVLAENGVDMGEYRVNITYGRSPNALLDGITIDGESLSSFRPEQTEYELRFFYTEPVPQVRWLKSDPQQTLLVNRNDMTIDGFRVSQFTCDVTAPDETNVASYTVTLKFNKTEVDTMAVSSRLASLSLFGEPVDVAHGFDYDFRPDTLHYTFRPYAIGSTNEVLFSAEDLTYTTIDPLATIDVRVQNREVMTDTFAVETDGTVIYRQVARSIVLTVSDRNGQNPTSYVISQSIELSRDSAVTEVYFAGVGFMDYDPLTHEYVKMIKEGTSAPGVTCVTGDSRAVCSIKYEEQTTETGVEKVWIIVCQSEYASIYEPTNVELRNIYTFRFCVSEINEADAPHEGDVLLKPIPHSTQVLLASLRSNVQVGFYDQDGRILQYRTLLACDPSNAIYTTDGYGNTFFSDVLDISKCSILTLEPNRVYFYVFLENGKKKIRSGKICIRQ